MQQAQPSAGQVAFNAANKPVGWIPKKTVRVLLDDDMNTGIAIYCVNCTVHAYFDASGSIDFSLAHGPTDGHFVLTGDFLLSRYLGIDAMYTGNFTLLDERLVEVGIPGFQIPGIVVVGPSITVNMKLGMEVKAQGSHDESHGHGYYSSNYRSITCRSRDFYAKCYRRTRPDGLNKVLLLGMVANA